MNHSIHKSVLSTIYSLDEFEYDRSVEVKQRMSYKNSKGMSRFYGCRNKNAISTC